VDETYIRVKGKWVYLYRAVESRGATIDIERIHIPGEMTAKVIAYLVECEFKLPV
jgi:hypothetical protein